MPSADTNPAPTAAKRDENLLLRGLRIVERMDSGAFRQSVFEDLSRHSIPVQVARAAHRALGKSRASSLLVAAYGLKSFVCNAMPRRGTPVLTIAAYRNEHRQLDYVRDIVGRDAFGTIRMDLGALAKPGGWLDALAALPHRRDLLRVMRIVHRINRRHDFLVTCRMVSTLGYYLRFARQLPASRARGVLVSSDANPYAIGLAFAARRHGLRTMYITHGHIQDAPPRLFFDLSILDGRCAQAVYEEEGPIEGDVVFRGSEGEYRPMDTSGLRKPRIRVGVFLSLIHDWQRLGRIIEGIRRVLRPEKIILRFHPNELVRVPDALEHFGRLDDVTISYGETVLLEDAARCDLVVAGNSSCHLTLLKYGVPTVYVRGFDTVPHDYYRFVRYRMIAACDDVDQLDPARIAAFYEDPGWVDRFAYFDASYVDRHCDEAVRNAVVRLLPGIEESRR